MAVVHLSECIRKIVSLKHLAISHAIGYHNDVGAHMNICRGVCFACSYIGTIYGDVTPTMSLAICERCRNSAGDYLPAHDVDEYPHRLARARGQARSVFAALLYVNAVTLTALQHTRIDTCELCGTSYSYISDSYGGTSKDTPMGICRICSAEARERIRVYRCKLPMIRVISAHNDITWLLLRWFVHLVME